MTEQQVNVPPAPPQGTISDADVTARPPAQTAPSEGATDKAQESAASAKDKAQEAAAPAKEKAHEVAGQAKEHAQAAAEQAKDKAAAQVDEKSTQVGQQIGSQGEALDGVAEELRRQGKEGQAKVAAQAAEKVKNVGDYLEQADGRSLVDSAQKVARENPAAAAAVGAAAGFAAGRVIKASREDEPPADEQTAPAPDPAVSDPGPGAP